MSRVVARLRGVHIELTVVGPSGRRDVAITAATPPTLDQVAPWLTEGVGAKPGSPLRSGSRCLEPTAVLGAPGLRTGSVITAGVVEPDAPRPGLLDLQVVGGAQAGAFVACRRGELIIGRDERCDVVLADDRVSRRHAALQVGAVSLRARDLGSTNGTSIDGRPVGHAPVPLTPGEIVRVGDSLLHVAGAGATAALVSPADGGLVVHRSPRGDAVPAIGPDTAAVIRIPVSDEVASPQRVQWITGLVPLLVGGVAAWLLSAPQFLLFALLSPVMLASGALGDRLHWRRSRRRRARDHARDLAAARRSIAEGLHAETVTRRVEAPDPAAVQRIVTVPSRRLWERRRDDPDALVVRLGSADLPSRLVSDDGTTTRAAGVVPTVPVTVDLRRGALALVGPDEVVAGVARWVVAQLAALTSPADLELVLLLRGPHVDRWQWARWLPHRRAAVAIGPAAWVIELSRLTRLVARRRPTGGAAERWTGHRILLVVDDVSGAEGTGLNALLTDGPTVGVTALCVSSDPSSTPATCAAVATCGGPSGSRIVVRGGDVRGDAVRGDAVRGDAVIDRVTEQWSDQVARALAPYVDAEDERSILPPEVSLAELLPAGDLVDTVTAAWGSSDGRARAVLGCSVDGPVAVDLVADGPHALVAGTTGSGKSELLRTLVAAMAIGQPPDALTLLLIDYKGGAAFAQCAQLPHCVGLVTDLDGELTVRALRSLNAELRRREEQFAAVGASDLTDYRGRDGPPLARLVIVVDEFAALAGELPQFVDGLVGVAQRGRSLGVHLVLATQRPGTAVSADIRANTAVRIALRVTDVTEAVDVIDVPAAAHLDPAYPGRACLRTAGRLVTFQSASVTSPAPVDDVIGVEFLDEWRGRTTSDVNAAGGATFLADLVDATRRAAQRCAIAPPPRPWLPPLPDDLLLSALPSAPEDRDVVVLGLADHPDRQRQPVLTLDLHEAPAVLLVGCGSSGRTGVLHAVAVAAGTRWSPAELTVHAIDGSDGLLAPLAGLPHLATAASGRDDQLVATLLERLVRAAGQPGIERRRSLLLVDRWDLVLSGRDDAAAARLSDLMARLLQLGRRAGMAVLVTGDRSLLLPRFAISFGERFLLGLGDAADHALAGLPAAVAAGRRPPGRGVRAADGALVQFARVDPPTGPVGGPTDVEDAVTRLAGRWRGVTGDPAAVMLRPLPRGRATGRAADRRAPVRRRRPG